MDRANIEKLVRKVLAEVADVEKQTPAEENIARWLGYTPTRREKKFQLEPLPKKSEPVPSAKNLIPKPRKPEKLEALIETTPARIAVWRAGTRYLTKVALKLRADHAVAKDAV